MLTTEARLGVMNRLGRAMADPTRARILTALLSGPTYPADLADALHLTRSNVSNHLTCLRGCGLVVVQSEGRRTLYAISDVHLARALALLVDAVLAVDDGEACGDTACDVPGCCADCAPTPTPRGRAGGRSA